MVKPVCLCLQLGEKGVTHLRSDCEWLSSLAIAEMCCIGYFAQCIANEMIERTFELISFEEISSDLFQCLSISFYVFQCFLMSFDVF